MRKGIAGAGRAEFRDGIGEGSEEDGNGVRPGIRST
ncbi:hypothetical protein chiPu_0033634, partial [Chiloscyllium punctatum]|nr:hypothetical protein [Chiloscyllium punctatum]